MIQNEELEALQTPRVVQATQLAPAAQKKRRARHPGLKDKVPHKRRARKEILNEEEEGDLM